MFILVLFVILELFEMCTLELFANTELFEKFVLVLFVISVLFEMFAQGLFERFVSTGGFMRFKGFEVSGFDATFEGFKGVEFKGDMTTELFQRGKSTCTGWLVIKQN